MKSPDFSRRRFLQGAALLSAPLILPGRVWSQATAPSKRLNVGCIGMGKQMGGHLGSFINRDDVEVLAALPDIDGDGENEILTEDAAGHACAFEIDGTLLWKTTDRVLDPDWVPFWGQVAPQVWRLRLSQ